MSIGAMGILGSAAATPLAQAKSGDVQRAAVDGAVQQHGVDLVAKAAAAAGIGKTDGENHATADRDADGRRLWETMQSKDPVAADAETSAETPVQSKDASGLTGTACDLTG